MFRGPGLKKSGKENDVENAVSEWFDTTRSRGQPLTGSLIRSKALEFANTLGIRDFTDSEDLLSRWKRT